MAELSDIVDKDTNTIMNTNTSVSGEMMNETQRYKV